MAYTTSGIAFQTVLYTDPTREDDYYTGTCNFANPNGVFFLMDKQKPLALYDMYYITDDKEEKDINVLSVRKWFKNGKITYSQTDSTKGFLMHRFLGTEKNVYMFSIKGVGNSGVDEDGTYGFSAHPIFDKNDTTSIIKYINNGDDSGALKDVSTKWNLYIDGTKNPLYKLTWNCPDIPTSDTSKVKVLFCASDDTIANTYIVKDTHYYDYNNKSVKLNYHDISEAVWGDMGGAVKGTVTIIVQFEYFETTTVVPTDTSAYMYCELYPNEKDGHMYGNIGFCKVGEHSTWFVKTDSGDGSTFTAHDGTEGSDGYTKDDDKGYDDNKDKDDADHDTAVLSSGIGVLTSTFHMTKERLVQLGQFLWGASIFDQFSLINNNPIENIISCKAIPYAISGTTQEITLGNVKTGVNGEKISQNFSKQTIGSVAIAER